MASLAQPPRMIAPEPASDRSRRAAERLRSVLIAVSLVAMVSGGLSASLGGLTLTADRALGLLLIPLLTVHLLANLGPRGPRRLLALWSAWLVVLAASMLLTGNLAGHMVPFLVAVIPVAYFSIFTIGPIDGRFVDRIARVLLWLQGALALVVLAAERVLGTNPYTSLFVDAIGRLKLLTFEPNLLGSITGFLILVTLPRARWTAANLALYLLSAVVIFGSFSKMPLVALVLGIILFSVLRARALQRAGTTELLLPLWIGGAAIAAAVAILPLIQDVYERLLDRADAVASRLYLYRLAITRFLESPIIGRGPGDFGLQNVNVLKQIGAYDQSNLWIGQMGISILHDSGVVGLLVYVIFLVALFAQAARWIRAGSLDHAGYVAGFASILIASQATTAHLLSLFGIAAGLVGSVPFVSAPSASRNTADRSG